MSSCIHLVVLLHIIVLLGICVCNDRRRINPNLNPNNPSTSRKIVIYHNHHRAQVNPSAMDMLQLNWYEPAMIDAQRWAEACQWLTHDNVTGRHTDEYGSCGQNIFLANRPMPWYFAIKKWNEEKNFFEYNGTIDMNVVGHYTQMVWYSTHKVGCGFSRCTYNNKIWFNYVCNYCPIGNHPDRNNRPYTSGPSCESCPNHCVHRKLCTNVCLGADQWLNCVELNATWHNWLCDDKEGENYQNCRATCDCADKIH